MLPPELGPVDEVVTPEGTVITPEAASAPGGGRSLPAPRGGAPAGDLADSRTAGTPADSRTAGTPADSGGGIRTGDHTSKSLKYSQEISSVDEEPERAGRSLVTTNHDVIRRWAQERNGVPATVDGTEHDGRAGVLRIDFPGGDSDRLRHIDWDEWFTVFDGRRLNFIYQEKRSDGRQSNFFRLESPNREDG
ncbi:MAG TPA: hypothetical protein VHN18_13160 [Micromonosporaceae bacterium]|nr:hypothetical protein [Micromonosporaceae bacterium]